MSDRDWRPGNPTREDIKEEERKKHDWFSAIVRDHQNVPTPVMLCRRKRCQIKWWPDRNEPKSECKGWGK